MVLLYENNLGDTIIAGNTDLGKNIILGIRGLVLCSLHIGLHTGGAKYRVLSNIAETVTNITVQNITKRIESYKIWEVTYTVLEVTYDEG